MPTIARIIDEPAGGGTRMDSRPDDEIADDSPRDQPAPAVDIVPDWLLPPVIGSLRRHRGRWTIAWYSFAVVVIVLLTTILVWPHQPNAAEQSVREFLSAVQAGNAMRAEHMATTDAGPGTGDRSFLTADVLRQHWHIDAVRSVDPADDDMFEATVDAMISTPDGDRASYRFTLERDREGAAWKVADPYVYVSFVDFPLSYVTINGHRVRLRHRDGQTASYSTYTLVPGLYRFFDTAAGAVRHSTAAHLLMPGSYNVVQAGDTGYLSGSDITVPRMTLTDAAQRSAQRAVDAYIDDCAKTAKLTTVGCPFGAEYVPEPGRPDYVFMDDEVKSLTWTVRRYPVVTIQPASGEFLVVDRRAGAMKLTVTGTDRDTGFTAKTSMTCDTNDNTLRVEITGSGKFRVYPAGGRYSMADVDHMPIMWQTC